MNKLCIKQSTVIIIIIIFYVLSICTLYIEIDDEEENNSNATENYHRDYHVPNSKITPVKESTCYAVECDITCMNITPKEDMSDSINNYIRPDVCNALDLLHIKYTNFPGGIIKQHWLKKLKLPIKKLIINKCPITDIGPNAFEGSVFSNLTTLELQDLTGLSTIKMLFFDNLPKIKTIKIHYENLFSNLKFQNNVFRFASTSLEILKIHNCLSSPIELHSIAGKTGALLPDLHELHLQYNHLQAIDEFSFNNSMNLRTLNLSNNFLTNINEKAFWGAPLDTIDISNNRLSYIPPNIFRDKCTSGGFIFAGDNKWKCVYKLQWLKDYYMNTGFLSRPMYCTEADGDYAFEYFDFGHEDDLTTLATSYTTSTEIPSTTEMIEENPTIYRSLVCHDVYYFPIKIPIITSRELLSHVTISLIQYEEVTVTIHNVGQLPIIEIHLEGNVRNYYLLWFQSDDTSEFGCYTNFHDEVFIYGLGHDRPYTLCLLTDLANHWAPFQCVGFRVLPEQSERLWLKNSSKVMTIAIVLAIVVAVSLLTSLVSFLLLRRHPKLFKGNKRVVIVKYNTIDAIVMPKEQKVVEKKDDSKF